MDLLLMEFFCETLICPQSKLFQVLILKALMNSTTYMLSDSQQHTKSGKITVK